MFEKTVECETCGEKIKTSLFNNRSICDSCEADKKEHKQLVQRFVKEFQRKAANDVARLEREQIKFIYDHAHEFVMYPNIFLNWIPFQIRNGSYRMRMLQQMKPEFKTATDVKGWIDKMCWLVVDDPCNGARLGDSKDES